MRNVNFHRKFIQRHLYTTFILTSILLCILLQKLMYAMNITIKLMLFEYIYIIRFISFISPTRLALFKHQQKDLSPNINVHHLHLNVLRETRACIRIVFTDISYWRGRYRMLQQKPSAVIVKCAFDKWMLFFRHRV